MSWQVVNIFDWLVRHHPSMAGHTLDEIVGEADIRSRIASKEPGFTDTIVLGWVGEIEEHDLTATLLCANRDKPWRFAVS